ncbi:MAG: hypothetical protein GY765_30440, partial [bacterium]|nr:hypothetical protein [bacterium]
GKYMPRFGIAFIPIMAAGHAIKSLLKTTSRLPYWEYIFSEPTGIETARSIQAKTLKLAALPGWRDPLMTFLAFALMLGAILISILVIRKLIAADVPQQGVRCAALYLIPILYGGIYTTMLIAWRFM